MKDLSTKFKQLRPRLQTIEARDKDLRVLVQKIARRRPVDLLLALRALETPCVEVVVLVELAGAVAGIHSLEAEDALLPVVVRALLAGELVRRGLLRQVRLSLVTTRDLPPAVRARETGRMHVASRHFPRHALLDELPADHTGLAHLAVAAHA